MPFLTYCKRCNLQLYLKSSLDIFRESINKMVDHSCDNITETKIRELVLQQQGVEGIDDLKTRMLERKCM